MIDGLMKELRPSAVGVWDSYWDGDGDGEGESERKEEDIAAQEMRESNTSEYNRYTNDTSTSMKRSQVE